MAPRQFRALDVDKTLAQLTLTEKITLLAGKDNWHTRPVPRLGIPSIRTTDGPSGARGTKFFEGTPAACFPAATGLAAAWDTEFAYRVGKAMAIDCKDKGAHVLLAPTVNMQRSPLAGRGFDSYSEDPLLSGLFARAFIQGVQSENIAATIKHYVCNDSEFERTSISAEVSARALREIYLRPFELAMRDNKDAPWAVMTSYGRVNGVHVSEHEYLLDSVLRQQWEWKGMIMSDWYGTYSSDAAINAGLDLEMPGPTTWRAEALQRCVIAQKVHVGDIDKCVRNVLELVNRVAASSIPEDADETGVPRKETVELLRQAASSANVLLKNDVSLLPLSATSVSSIAVIGPNADAPVYAGGGSSIVRPYRHTSVLEGIRAALAPVQVHHVIGAHAHKEAPLLLEKHLKTRTGEPGFDIDWFNEDPLVNPETRKVHYTRGTSSAAFFNDNLPTDILNPACWATITGYYTPEVSGTYEFGAAATGLVDVYVNGKKIIDNSTNPKPGNVFFSTGTREVCGTIELEAGEPAELVLQFASPAVAHTKGVAQFNVGYMSREARGGCRFGCSRVFEEDQGIKEAVELAKKVETVVLVVGLNNDWEAETYDRPDMALPRATNKLVEAVLEVNKDTIVVVISGTPVSMPWVNSASTIIQSFYGGGEAGNGLADVLFGKVNPSSKLPLTFPIRDEDAPSYLNFPGQNGKVLYAEGVFVGYRHYDSFKKDVLYPFGHGLSYTRFKYLSLQVAGSIGSSSTVTVSVTVENVGKVPGRDVVQIYVRDLASRLDRPAKELKGFGKTAALDPGQSESISITLDKYAFAYFDDWAGRDRRGAWVVEAGDFVIVAAASSADSGLSASISAQHTFSWL